MRKKKRGGRGKGREGKGERDGRESLGGKGEKGKGEGKFRGGGGRPPKCFFLEPRLGSAPEPAGGAYSAPQTT